MYIYIYIYRYTYIYIDTGAGLAMPVPPTARVLERDALPFKFSHSMRTVAPDLVERLPGWCLNTFRNDAAATRFEFNQFLREMECRCKATWSRWKVAWKKGAQNPMARGRFT